MPNFILKQLPYDLSAQAGLALIGKYLQRINLNRLVDAQFPGSGDESAAPDRPAHAARTRSADAP
ncbi:MAG: hypothetical protein PHX60_13025 [Giesbergeria sp.]|uniref:hypothetical protein n=1 Tax=Giesbergeria sp. TaxID=2818473 RepID=UPI00260A39C4|nr:hypothetical protein [Giesbergeria sp.]MDD2610584.1 hypothetical protein [Giesbergeria sp.]